MEENAATILAELFYDQVMDNTHPENVFVSSDDFQDVYLPWLGIIIIYTFYSDQNDHNTNK